MKAIAPGVYQNEHGFWIRPTVSPEARLLIRCAIKTFKRRGELEALKEARATLYQGVLAHARTRA